MMRWLRPLLRRSAVEREMDSELRFHFDRLVEEHRRRGLSLEEARRRARLEFGGVDQIKDDAREARLADRLERLVRNLRQAFRILRKSPGFTAVAVLTLALGIGVNTLMFSLFDQLLLRNLPVRDPNRLVVLHGNFMTPGMYRSNRMMSFSWPKYVAFRDHGEVFSGVAARFVAAGSFEHNGNPERVTVELVSGNYFDVVGVPAAVGRVFTSSDAVTPMSHPVAVLGYAFWQRRFGGDPGMVGSVVRINGMPMTVVGVSAAGYHSMDRGDEEDVRVPIMMKDLFTPSWPGITNPMWAWLNIVGRIKPGMPRAQAEAGANVFYKQLLQEQAKLLPVTYSRRREFLNDHLDLTPLAAGMQDQAGGQKTFLLELMAICGVVLLIACVNLTGLLMARTTARQRELAIRLALGAGRWGIIRQVLTENLLLAAAGGAAGILLAAALAEPAARYLIAPSAGQLIDVPLDLRILLFALAVTLLTAAAFAIAPVLQLRRPELSGVLKTESGSSASRGQVRMRKIMVAAQLSFCVWLMIAAGLFARSLSRLRAADLGFHREHLLTFQIDPMISGYKADQGVTAHRRLTSALATLPGVTAVGNSDYGLLTFGINFMNIRIEGYQPPPPDTVTQVRELVVSPGYFNAVGIPLVAGRDFAAVDLHEPIRTAIVDEAFAQKYMPGQNPVGRHFAWAGRPQIPFEIVGVVRSHRYDGPSSDVAPFYYLPGDQNGRLSYYVRVAQAPEAMLATVGRVVAREMPGVPLEQLRTMDERFDSVIGNDSRIASMAGFFGLLATLLAAIGLYGVMAFTVSRRTREIGIRMAIGASGRDVLWMVIREVGVVVACGLMIGLPTGLVLTRLIRSQLYNVSPMDAPATLAAASVVAAIGLLAGYLPARRATRINPVSALRWD
jgi:predicted permease